MLVEHDRVSVWVGQGDISGSRRGFIGFFIQFNAVCLQVLLYPPHIRRDEGQQVLFEHPLKQPNDCVSVLENDPILVPVVIVDPRIGESLSDQAREVYRAEIVQGDIASSAILARIRLDRAARVVRCCCCWRRCLWGWLTCRLLFPIGGPGPPGNELCCGADHQ